MCLNDCIFFFDGLIKTQGRPLRWTTLIIFLDSSHTFTFLHSITCDLKKERDELHPKSKISLKRLNENQKNKLKVKTSFWSLHFRIKVNLAPTFLQGCETWTGPYGPTKLTKNHLSRRFFKPQEPASYARKSANRANRGWTFWVSKS